MALRSKRIRWCTAAAAGCVVLCLVAAPAQATSKHRQARAHPQAVKPKVYTGAGFDACTAPSPEAMTAWWGSSGYQALGIYLGGVNRSCDGGNLTHDWVAAVTKTGWRLAPIYAGLQAPCARQPHLKLMDPKVLAKQANSAADDAVNQAAALGIVRGSAIYYDLEAYPRKNPTCTSAVLTYLGGWTKRLHKRGYFSGLYASADSGASDFAAAAIPGPERQTPCGSRAGTTPARCRTVRYPPACGRRIGGSSSSPEGTRSRTAA